MLLTAEPRPSHTNIPGKRQVEPCAVPRVLITLPDKPSPAQSLMLTGVLDSLMQRGQAAGILPSFSPLEVRTGLRSALKEGGVFGVISICEPWRVEPVIPELAMLGIPLVALQGGSILCHRVAVDTRLAGQMAAEHLAVRAERFVVLSDASVDRPDPEFIEGFREGLAMHGKHNDELPVLSASRGGPQVGDSWRLISAWTLGGVPACSAPGASNWRFHSCPDWPPKEWNHPGISAWSAWRIPP